MTTSTHHPRRREVREKFNTVPVVASPTVTHSRNGRDLSGAPARRLRDVWKFIRAVSYPLGREIKRISLIIHLVEVGSCACKKKKKRKKKERGDYGRKKEGTRRRIKRREHDNRTSHGEEHSRSLSANRRLFE